MEWKKRGRRKEVQGDRRMTLAGQVLDKKGKTPPNACGRLVASGLIHGLVEQENGS